MASVQTHICTDTTYIYTLLDGWVYQLTFAYLMTPKIIHYSVADTINDGFVSSNTQNLLDKYSIIELIHADCGSQYTSKRFRKLLADHHVIASYNEPEYPYDNTQIESYHACLEREKLYRYKIINLVDAKRLVFEYNYGFYNTYRIHTSIDYLTPNEFEKQLLLES